MKVSEKISFSLEGSTIIETVISMTILLTILTLFFTQIGKIDNASNPHSIYFAYKLTEKLFNSDDILIEQDKPFQYENFLIDKRIESVQASLYLIELTVKSQSGREIYKRSKWISESIEL